MYFGLAEISTAIAIDKKISHATNVAGDLATQHAIINPDDFEQIIQAVLKILDLPDSELSKVSVEIHSWGKDAGGTVTPQGTGNFGRNFNGPNFSVGNINNNLLTPSSGVVMAQISYDYEPLKLRYFNSTVVLKERFFLKPRKSSVVQFGANTISCNMRGTTSANLLCR